MDMNEVRRVYNDRLKGELELAHSGRVVAIDPESGEYTLGDDLSEALDAALAAHPAGKFGVLRIGGGAVVRVGALPEDSRMGT